MIYKKTVLNIKKRIISPKEKIRRETIKNKYKSQKQDIINRINSTDSGYGQLENKDKATSIDAIYSGDKGGLNVTARKMSKSVNASEIKDPYEEAEKLKKKIKMKMLLEPIREKERNEKKKANLRGKV